MGWTPPTASLCQGRGVMNRYEGASYGEGYHHRDRLGEACVSGPRCLRRRVGGIPKEDFQGQASALSVVAAEMRGGDGGLCRCTWLGARYSSPRARGSLDRAGLREAIREAAEERHG